MELTSGAIAFGSVFLRGEPVPNCKVYVLRIMDSTFSVYSATTNSAGVWKLKDVPPGKYCVWGTSEPSTGTIFISSGNLIEIRKRQARELGFLSLD